MAIQIRALEAEDIPQLLHVVALALGSGPAGARSEAWWRWKHLQNPFGPSLVLGAFEAGELVGVRAFLRWQLSHASGLLHCARAVDTATHPRFQGRGIFRALTQAGLSQLAEQGTHLVFNTPNEKSGAGYLTMGWQQIAPLRAAIRPNGAAGALRMAGGLTRLLPAGTNRSAGVKLPTVADWMAAQPADRLQRLVQRLARRTGGLKTNWTDAALHWRFAANPIADYRVLAQQDSDDVAFIRLNQRRGLHEAVVSLCSTASGDPQPLLRGLREPALDYFIWRRGEPAMGALAALAAGFIEPPLSAMTLMARQVTASDAVFAECRNAAQWRLEFGDLELL